MRLPALDITPVTVTVEGIGEVTAYPFGAGTLAQLQGNDGRIAPIIDALRVSLRDYEDVDAWLDTLPPDLVGALLSAIDEAGDVVRRAEKNSPPTAG